MNNEGLWTSVTGSFPLANTNENIQRTIEDQINIGIDYPCYGQLESILTQFLFPLSEKLPEFELLNNRFYLHDDFSIPNEPIGTDYIKFLMDFLEKRKELKTKIKGTKGCLTGPFTLASEIILSENLSKGLRSILFSEPRAIMVGWIVSKVAEIMKIVAKNYSNMGVNIIAIDEPILGLLVGKKIMFHSEDFIIKTLNNVVSETNCLSSVHVCGQVSPKLRDILLQTDINILDHEFQTNENNYDIFKKSHFERHDKYLALGAVKTKIRPKKDSQINDYVESETEIKEILKKAIKLYGKQNLFIKPDCGFLPLRDVFEEDFAYEITIRKLKNMVSAVKKLK
ncbi:MAG: hypothetical protein KGD63_06110 [Candidatus Lokiarchaeota archaeon]|nr:hypothetical protein [Candidatus Lokiarchaeota archaeon]